MNLILKMIFLCLLFDIIIFCQNSGKNSCWYPAEYFSGENAIESQEIIFNEDALVSIYKHFTCDILISQVSIKRYSVFPVSNSYIEFMTGKATILRDTIITCNSDDDFSVNEIALKIGDTLDYYFYHGEGSHQVGKNDCMFELDNYPINNIIILTNNKILAHSLYVEKFQGWLKLEENNVELKTKWVKEY